MSSIKCLIYERDLSGHRLQHVRLLTDALLHVGCEVVVALQSDALNRDEYRAHMEPLHTHIELIARLNPVQKRGYPAAAARVDELLQMVALARPDWVYIPYADVITQAAAVRSVLRGLGDFRRTPIEGQVMRGRYAYPQDSLVDYFKGASSRWLMQSSPWHVTHLLDPWVYENLQGTARSTEFRLIPEPVEPLPPLDRIEARKALAIPTDGRYVVMAGAIEAYKGMDLLLAAFARTGLHSDDRLLVIGKMAQQVRDLIAREYGDLSRSGRLVVVDRYLSNFEIFAAFLASDVLVAPHPRHMGSSHTLARASAAKRQVIVCDFGLLGWATREFGLGAAVDVANPDVFAVAIDTALQRSANWQPGERAARFIQYHTAENQKAHWLASLGRERGVNLRDLASRIDWGWVCESIGPH
jgi:glycosyltransferase involved in cell wall biosynthesis